MNTGKSGGIGRAKHRQAFGRNPVSRAVKLAVERDVNMTKKKRPVAVFVGSIRELFDWR